MKLTGLLIAGVGLALLVAGMLLIGVPTPIVGALIAVCGLAVIVVGVTVNWDDDAKPAE